MLSRALSNFAEQATNRTFGMLWSFVLSTTNAAPACESRLNLLSCWVSAACGKSQVSLRFFERFAVPFSLKQPPQPNGARGCERDCATSFLPEHHFLCTRLGHEVAVRDPRPSTAS